MRDIKKIGGTILTVALIAAVLVEVYPPPTANAQLLEGAGFVLGQIKPQPVVDLPAEASAVTNTASTVGGWLAQAARFAIDNGLKIALAALKKRLIDTMTDEIIAWINNGGSPKFITNFSQQVFQPALNQAVGDTAQQILPTLCSPYTFRVNLELSAPQPLNQPSACTLNSIVSNFNAFRENFAAGGFLGYSELLQPQNNPYGVDILTQDALYNNVQQVTAQNVLQTQVNVGFNSQQCVSWQLVDANTKQALYPGVTASFQDYQDPNTPPPLSGQYLIDGVKGAALDASFNVNNLAWRCADLQINTPGRAIEEGLNQALYANLNLTINDPEITNALAMIADAAFNRLIKAGVQGVQGIVQSATTGGNGQTTLSDVTAQQVVGGAEANTGGGSLGQAISNASDLSNQAASSTQQAYLAQLSQASSSLADAATALADASSTNVNLIATLNSLVTCTGTGSSSTDLAWATSTLTIASSSASTTIPAYSDQVSNLRTTVGGFAAQVQNADANTLNQIDQNGLATAVADSTQIDGNAQILLSNIQTTLATAQTKLTQCQASH